MLPRVNLVRSDHADYLLFSTNDAISLTMYFNGDWAKLIADISSVFCDGVAEPLVVDIGANLGGYAVPMAQKLAPAGGTLYAFEPQRVIFYQLCGNTFLNRLDNLHPFHLALGATDGTITLPNIDYGKSTNIGGFGFDDCENRQAGIKFAQGSTTVPMSRLDSIVLPKSPSLIKIDVEGAELEVLRGADDTLRRAHYPPLILEAWLAEWFAPRRAMLLAHLEGLGYGYLTLGEDVIAQHPDHPRQFEFRVDEAGTLNMIRVR
jgi:FkbM family methyltransferase